MGLRAAPLAETYDGRPTLAGEPQELHHLGEILRVDYGLTGAW